MFSILLAVIYLAFISLGLPDSLLGAAWPVMYRTLGVPLSYAGIVSMMIAGSTIASSLLSDRMTRRFGTGVVTAASVLLTAAALFGFSFSNRFWMLCLWAIPYGLGAGAVDAALNNYVALHYASRHMSWLHCFWGVGAAISPYIMGFAISSSAGWNGGYRYVGVMQLVLTAILILTLRRWKTPADSGSPAANARPKSLSEVLHIPGVPLVLLTFLGYCAVETTAGLWASSYLVQYRGVEPVTAARFASLFYIGITAGRFLCGFVADRLGDRALIRIGVSTAIFGAVLIALPSTPTWLPLSGLIVVGLGCAPVYPSIIHATPANFGEENSQAIIGVQMASAYTGSTFMPPLFGLIAERVSIGLYPYYLLLFAGLMLAMSELLNRRKA